MASEKVGHRALDPYLFLAGQVVLGPFRFRIRTCICREGVLQLLQWLRSPRLLDTFPGAPPAFSPVFVRLVSYEAMQTLIAAVRGTMIQPDHIGAPLLALRCRIAEELARKGLVSRAVRVLHKYREAKRSTWAVEGHYRLATRSCRRSDGFSAKTPPPVLGR